MPKKIVIPMFLEIAPALSNAQLKTQDTEPKASQEASPPPIQPDRPALDFSGKGERPEPADTRVLG